jgi:sulfonate transport system ATP-binding protein
MASRSAGGLTLPRRPARDRPRPGATALADGAPVVSIGGLRRSFAGRVVLDGLDLEISRGEFVALIGRSGSGKSTLLRGLAGLDPGLEGDMEVSGTVAMAFQGARLVPWKRVLDNVRLGLRGADPIGVARSALAEVGLQDHHEAWPLTLSGGEAQRVSLARALVRDPDLMLLDEPFGALDALTRMSMHRLVLGLWERHRPAVLLVTHDVDEALALADRVLVLGGGRITHQAAVRVDRPRDREHPDLISLRNRLLTELGVDTKEGTA